MNDNNQNDYILINDVYIKYENIIDVQTPGYGELRISAICLYENCLTTYSFFLNTEDGEKYYNLLKQFINCDKIK